MSDKIKSFNRSQYMRDKHSLAKLEYQTYKQDYPDKPIKYKDFMKKETPISSYYMAYEVSYQVSYSGPVDNITISPQTFEVYALSNNRDVIEKQVMNMVLDSKGVNSKSHLQPNTINAMEKGFKAQIKPRGMEQKDISSLTFSQKEQILRDRTIVKNLDNQIEMVNKKGSKGTLQLDITHFIE